MLEGVLDDPDAPLATKLKAAEMVMDRHPSGEFAKHSKQERRTRRTGAYVTSAQIDKLSHTAVKRMLKGSTDEKTAD